MGFYSIAICWIWSRNRRSVIRDRFCHLGLVWFGIGYFRRRLLVFPIEGKRRWLLLQRSQSMTEGWVSLCRHFCSDLSFGMYRSLHQVVRTLTIYQDFKPLTSGYKQRKRTTTMCHGTNLWRCLNGRVRSIIALWSDQTSGLHHHSCVVIVDSRTKL